VDDLVARGTRALVQVHRSGAYLGQAVARNIVLTGSGVGFIDFEEDPLEVMSLGEAQARDWLLFSSSIARYYEMREGDLAAIFGHALPSVGNDVAMTVSDAAGRLAFLKRLTRRLGARGRAVGVAVASLCLAGEGKSRG
jgi:tRNA A-37 threonylcarbamoyl transferase component Bud32